MEHEFLIHGRALKIRMEKKGNAFLIQDGELSFEADIQSISENAVSLIANGRSFLAYIARDKDQIFVFLNGRSYAFQEPGQMTAAFEKGEDRGQEGKLQVKAPMPGKVIKINVAEGDEVRKNQTLLIVEAMKMENEIKSTIEGIVKKICAAAGELVDSEKTLIELEPKK
jgi:biotin carboxyl carrier protein